MKPHDVLRAQADLVAAVGTPAFASYMGAMLPRLLGVTDAPITGLPSSWADLGADWCTAAAHSLSNAGSYLIDADAIPLIRAGAEALPGSLAVTEQMLPTPEGFVMFAEPYEIADVHGRLMRTRALSWSMLTAEQVRAGKVEELPGADNFQERFTGGGLVVVFWSSFADRDEARDTVDLRAVRARLGDLTVYHQTSIPLNLPLADWDAYQAARIQDPVTVDPVDATIALWLLMRQPVLDTTEAPLTDRNRGRWQRRNIPGRVSVVRLRRRASANAPTPHPGETAASWSCRWIVRGHWHPYRTGPGRTEITWRLVHPYVKGPENKPLRESPRRVYRVTGEPTPGQEAS